MTTLDDKLQLIKTYKSDMQETISNKGIEITSTTPLSEYANKISEIESPLTFDATFVHSGVFVDPTTHIASGFSTDGYLKLPEIYQLGNASTFEMVFKVKMGSDALTNQELIHFSINDTNSGRYGVGFNIQSNKTNLFISSDGTSWLFDLNGTYSILANTLYYFKITFDGSIYKLSISEDGVSYTDDITYSSTSKVYSSLTSEKLGIYTSNEVKDPWLGLVYLPDCYIKMDDIEVWRGTT